MDSKRFPRVTLPSPKQQCTITPLASPRTSITRRVAELVKKGISISCKFYPIRLAYTLALVRLDWLISLKRKNASTGKRRIGFGPVLTGEGTLHTRKWWIDPIVDGINSSDYPFVADIFLRGDNLRSFDIVVIVKNFDFLSDIALRELKRKGTILIYVIVDNPAGCYRNYQTEGGFLALMDGIIVCNPLQQRDVEQYPARICYVDSPVINKTYKSSYRENDTISVLWEGMNKNRYYMLGVERVLEEIALTSRRRVELIYFTEKRGQDHGIVRYLKWKLGRREEVLNAADIAITVKTEDDCYQQRKPSTKVCSYMAAGLPVICTPTPADKRIIRHGVTGFFAYSDAEWRHVLEILIADSGLRERVGIAAREYATHQLSIERIVERYIAFFSELDASVASESSREAQLDGAGSGLQSR